MKPVDAAWQCEVCSARYPTQKEAEACREGYGCSHDYRAWHRVMESIPMGCRHNDEGTADCDKVLADCKSGLAELGYNVTDDSFLSVVICSLEHELGGWSLHHLAMDMWYGAGISRYKTVETTQGKVSAPGWYLNTQGDTAEDCLAALWLRAREIHNEEEAARKEEAGEDSTPAP